MNKQIKELLYEAGGQYGGKHFATGQDVIYTEEVDYEKFAELIVLECVNKQLALAAIYETSIPGYEPVSSEFLDGTINGLKEGAELIKQHFGVSK